jgi:hypothetical protein
MNVNYGALVLKLQYARPRLTMFLLATLAALAVALTAGIMFRRATTPWASLPDYDYWANIVGVISSDGIRLEPSALFRHNNEHIIVIPKLIYAANYLATSGSNIGLIVYSLVVGALCSTLLLYLTRNLFIDTPLRFAFCAILFPAVMFSPKLVHSYFMGMSGTIWLTADLFVVLSAAALARAVATTNSNWLLMSLLAGLLGVLTYSTSIYALIFLLCFCLVLLARPALRGMLSRSVLISAAALIIVVLGILWVYRTSPSGHPPWEFDLKLIYFVLIYIGNSLPTNSVVRPAAGLIILALGAGCIHYLIIQGRAKDILHWIMLFLFAPFNALMTGIGRLGFGAEVATSSRYQSVAAVSLIATIALALAAVPKGVLSRPMAIARALCFIGFGVGAAVIAFQPGGATAKFYSTRNEKKVIAEIALRQGIQGDHHLRAATPAIAQLDSLIPMLRAARHVPFDRKSRCEEMLGQHRPKTTAPTAGLVETLSIYDMSHGAGRAIELSGWAERNGDAAECIIIVDGSGTVIGTGASVSRRSDLKPARGTTGWKAVAALPQGMPVCAFALFPGESQWTPLANCCDKILNAAECKSTQPRSIPGIGPNT